MSEIMIVAGEASGDLHGANLVRATRNLLPGAVFFGMGGERMRAAGVELLFDLEHMNLMGLTEVLSSLWRVGVMLKTLKKAMANRRPAALVLIDYPDFNFRLARVAYELKVPVFYYICPQIWAWRTGRLRLMAELVNRRVVVFPFEAEYYARHGLTADFVGHPLLDVMEPPRPKAEAKAALGLDPEQELLLLMPGSRPALVRRLLPAMLDAAGLIRKKYPGLGLVLARAETLIPHTADDILDPFLASGPADLKVVSGRSHELQNAADLALVASGTSTLETALMATPMVVIYRVSAVSWLLARLLVHTEHVAMANLIAGTRLVPELLQDEADSERIATEAIRFLDSPQVRAETVAGLEAVRGRLGGPGASRRAAGLLLETMGHPRPFTD